MDSKFKIAELHTDESGSDGNDVGQATARGGFRRRTVVEERGFEVPVRRRRHQSIGDEEEEEEEKGINWNKYLEFHQTKSKWKKNLW